MERLNKTTPIRIDGSSATLLLSPFDNRIAMTRAVIILLGNPTRVKLLMNSDYKSFALAAADDDEKNSFRIPKYVYKRGGTFRISSKFLIENIWKVMEWDSEQTYKINGCHDKQKQVVFFNLTVADTISGENDM